MENYSPSASIYLNVLITQQNWNFYKLLQELTFTDSDI